MNVGSAVCDGMAVLFLLLAATFGLLGERGAMLISGFNTLPKEEREHYDRKRMSRDMRNALFLWAVVWGIGSVLCVFVCQYFAILAFAVWSVLFFRQVHLDARKAFEKYRLP